MNIAAVAIVFLVCLTAPLSVRANISPLICNNVNVNLNDCIDLVFLYDSTDGDNWTNNTNWGTPDVSSWYGVVVDQMTHRVFLLDLAQNNLSGTFPLEINGLQALEYLQLSSNRKLKGHLPAYLGNLQALKVLQVGFDGLDGPVPESLGNLTQLEDLYLGSNHFSGTLPATIGNLTRLEVLTAFPDIYSYGGRLTGPLPDLSRLTRLRQLDLNGNGIEGPLPDYFDQMPALEDIRLRGNNFTGSLPSSLGTLSNLRKLDISSNKLTGVIPSTLGNLSSLEDLDLSYNDFTSTLPSTLGNLSALRELRIAGATVALLADRQRITGPIPPSLGNLSQLETLYLGFNQLSGTLPESLGGLSALRRLSLPVNDLDGPVPDAYTMLDLDYLNIGANLLNSDADNRLVLNPMVQAWFDTIPHTRGDFPPFGPVYSTIQRSPVEHPDTIFSDGFEVTQSSAWP